MSGYDLVLSDGSVKVKCLLSPALNELVEKGGIQESAVLRVRAGGVLVVVIVAPSHCYVSCR